MPDQIPDESLQRLAYEFWELRGRPMWDAERDWLTAQQAMAIHHFIATQATRNPAVPTPVTKPCIQADGSHLYPIEEVSIPAHGISLGTGTLTWHPSRGIGFQVEMPTSTPTNIDDAFAQFKNMTGPSSKAGAICAPSREPDISGQITGTQNLFRLYGISATPSQKTQFGTAGASAKAIVTGAAMAATVRIDGNSELSYLQESVGDNRLLIPDMSTYHWTNAENAIWEFDGIQHCSSRSSCSISVATQLNLFSASALAGRKACWLAFPANLLPAGERDWHIPDTCHAAISLLSFLSGKRLPLLWLDRLGDSSITRTYFGLERVDDFPGGIRNCQAVPLFSMLDGQAVVEELPSLFDSYLRLRKWFDLAWIVGPLWYAIDSYVDDKLGLASVALERFATALDVYLKANPDQHISKSPFLTKQQSKKVRTALLRTIATFSEQQGIDLAADHSSKVVSAINSTVEVLANIDNSLFPSNVLPSLRTAMKDALQEVNDSENLRLDLQKQTIIERRIASFAEKTNPDKLINAIEFDGLCINDAEYEAVMKRNDCLHGRRTLVDGDDLQSVDLEIRMFDTLKTLIAKALLVRLGYKGKFIDYGARPPSGPFPVRPLNAAP